MGIFKNALFLLPSLWLFFFLLIINITISTSYGEINHTPSSSDSLLTDPPPLLPPPPPPPPYRSKETPFRPSIAVVVGLLTTIFSITFLILMYAKHCRRGTIIGTTTYNSTSGGAPATSTLRKNSGIDRTVIESLPVFRFGSLRGQKDGLECAVCLNRFEPTEILRLLPKCKHAFHVECVDTWLDAHSTCPLCRYRVDPEDILLISHENDKRKSFSNSNFSPAVPSSPAAKKSKKSASGRHSWAGDRGSSSSSSLQIIVETPKDDDENENKNERRTLFNKRNSLDSWNMNKKRSNSTNSSSSYARKDGALLLSDNNNNNNSINKNKKVVVVEPAEEQHRLDHRIIISGDDSTAADETGGPQYRWSDVERSDMLLLKSEMILKESRGYSRRWTGEIERMNGNSRCGSGSGSGSGRGVINERSVSEMTGVSRFRSNEEREQQEGVVVERQRQRAGAVNRWMAWISSQPKQSVPDVRSDSTAASSSSAT